MERDISLGRPYVDGRQEIFHVRESRWNAFDPSKEGNYQQIPARRATWTAVARQEDDLRHDLLRKDLVRNITE